MTVGIKHITSKGGAREKPDTVSRPQRSGKGMRRAKIEFT
jgi:hypothetical protein